MFYGHPTVDKCPPTGARNEIPSGFAVEDATGQQLGVFYGRADPNIAGHTGFLTLDEARQMAIDFARLPKLLKQDAPNDPAQRQAVSEQELEAG